MKEAGWSLKKLQERGAEGGEGGGYQDTRDLAKAGWDSSSSFNMLIFFSVIPF